ncbi:MAG: hypothetical protein JJU45_16310 [Acidimicrobiia bacterium]|nr:hypothetical protein [Acidimicrobiia bacterium]
MAESIALKNPRVTTSRASIELGDGRLDLVLPTFFGRRRWTVPMAEVGVADLTSPLFDDQASGLVFREAVHIPYFYSTGPASMPTTLLLFKTPQRTPPCASSSRSATTATSLSAGVSPARPPAPESTERYFAPRVLR